MLRIEFDQKKMDRLVEDMQAAPQSIQQGIKEVIMSSVLQVHSIAVKPGYAPYKTGNLRRSITFKVGEAAGKVEGAVGSNLVYAAIHEFGGVAGRGHSVQIKPKRYLGRAIDESKKDIADRFLKIKILKK